MNNIIYIQKGKHILYLLIHRFTLLHGEDEWDQFNNKSNYKELFIESITINELPPYALEKCITIQWPEFNFEKTSYVSNYQFDNKIMSG